MRTRNGWPIPEDRPNRFAALVSVMDEALADAAEGKGAVRHDQNRDPYEDQQIVQIGEWMGSNHFNVGQAVKKALESCHLPPEQARKELLGAINYLAAAVITLDKIAGRGDNGTT